jgi:enoyl-CoA hydratase
MSAEGWVTEVDGDVVVARFARPPMNYFLDDDIERLSEHVDEWTAEGVRAVVLAGGVEGRFITHFNVDEILKKQTVVPEGPIDAPLRSRSMHALTRKITRAPMPVIAAMNGDTMGAGSELSLACDIRIGERGDYRYGLIEVRLGIVPGGTGLTRLARMLGTGRAMQLGAGARAMTPEEAHEVGFVEELEDDALVAATAMAQRMAELPRTAVAMAKRIVHQGAGQPLDVALELELEYVYRIKQASDVAEALSEYLAQPLEQRRDWLDR